MQANEIQQPIFGSWYIDEKIGSGAFGTVYKIKREEFGETYYSALKVITIPADTSEVSTLLSEGMDDLSITSYYQEIVQNLIQEIKILNSLKGNSNIVSYEDHQIITEDEGRKYTILIRMELLIPLNIYLSDNKLDDNAIVKLGMDICNALILCEQHGIIHRDIKPDNIFVTKDGNFKLGDFGVARTMEKTMSAMSQKGTYTYMAPEVYWNKPYNKTADIYSLGLVLYQLLNQNRAPFLPPVPNPIKFSDRENATKRRMQGDEIPLLNIENQYLNAVVLKACNAEIDKRYSNANEMKEVLKKSVEIKKDKSMNNEMDFENTVSPLSSIPNDNSQKFANNTPTQEDDFDKTVGAFGEIPKEYNNPSVNPSPQPVNPSVKTTQQISSNTSVLTVLPSHKLFESYKLAWQNFANFKGRARCSDYWQFVLANIIVTFGISIISAPLMAVLGVLGEIPLVLYMLAIMIPSLSLLVRRLQDTGKEWYYILVALIPIVGSIILLIWCTKNSVMDENKFGPSPKYTPNAMSINKY